MVDIRQDVRCETQGAGTRPARAGTGAGAAEGRRRAAPRESVPVKPLAAWAALTGKAQKAGAAFCLGFCGTLEGWNRAQRRALSIWNSRESEQPRGERSASPSPQRKATSNLNKRPPPPACVRAEIRHWRDQQREAKQREPLQKRPVQQVKIPVGDTDYTGRGL